MHKHFTAPSMQGSPHICRTNSESCHLYAINCIIRSLIVHMEIFRGRIKVTIFNAYTLYYHTMLYWTRNNRIYVYANHLIMTVDTCLTSVILSDQLRVVVVSVMNHRDHYRTSNRTPQISNYSS